MRQARDPQTGCTIYYQLCDSCQKAFDEADMAHVDVWGRHFCWSCYELPEDDDPGEPRSGGTLEQIR